MKGFSKALLGLAAAAVIVIGSMPVAEAQCANARNLGGGSGNNTNSRIKLTAAWDLTDTAIGSIWQVGASGAVNSGGSHFGNGGACPVTNWVVTGGMFPGLGAIAIDASLASPTCLLSNCPAPASTVITVVEDASPDGSTAGFVAYTVDETPAGFRWFDHARTIGQVVGINEVAFQEFPSVEVTASAGPPPNTSITSNYADLAINVHAAAGAGDTAQPASGSVVSYDILRATAMTDPGRNRSAYTPVKSIPYSDAAVVADNIAVPCDGTAANTFLAVGVTYVDGIQSILVGPAVAVECDPAHADPGGNQDLREPKLRRNRTQSVSRGR
jgi:hypothetical protein